MIYKLTIVDDFDKLIEKGDAVIVANKELGYDQLVIVCPGCGKVSASAGKHKYDKPTMTYSPSIVHDKALGGCGWHGWLIHGVFKEC